MCTYVTEASISEKFYGMKRVPSARCVDDRIDGIVLYEFLCSRQESRLLFHRRISDTKKMLSMFFLVLAV